MKKSKIIFVTGGQRSGKSVFAESLALSLSEHPLYIATAMVHDDEFRRRVDIHQQRRGDRWTTFERPVHVSDVVLPADAVVLFDCVTLWATNVFFANGENIEAALNFMQSELEKLAATGATFIFVTNEIGLGGTSSNALQRAFTDLQGSINQTIASLADEAFMVLSGIPVKIK